MWIPFVVVRSYSAAAARLALLGPCLNGIGAICREIKGVARQAERESSDQWCPVRSVVPRPIEISRIEAFELEIYLGRDLEMKEDGDRILKTIKSP